VFSWPVCRPWSETEDERESFSMLLIKHCYALPLRYVRPPPHVLNLILQSKNAIPTWEIKQCSPSTWKWFKCQFGWQSSTPGRGFVENVFSDSPIKSLRGLWCWCVILDEPIFLWTRVMLFKKLVIDFKLFSRPKII